MDGFAISETVSHVLARADSTGRLALGYPRSLPRPFIGSELGPKYHPGLTIGIERSFTKSVCLGIPPGNSRKEQGFARCIFRFGLGDSAVFVIGRPLNRPASFPCLAVVGNRQTPFANHVVVNVVANFLRHSLSEREAGEHKCEYD